MASFRVRFKTVGSHVLARVLVNDAWAGELWFRVGAEWESFRSALAAEYVDETIAPADASRGGT